MVFSVTAATVLQIIAATAVIAIVTRVVTGVRYSSAMTEGSDSRVPPTLPYWIPYFGDFFALFPIISRYQRVDQRGGIPRDIFSHYVRGNTFIVVAGVRAAYEIFEKLKQLSCVPAQWHILRHVFGAHKSQRQDYERVAGLHRTTMLPSTINDTVELMRVLSQTVAQQAPELVSFNHSLVDQHTWEREARIVVDEEAPVSGKAEMSVEADMFALIKAFVGNCLISSMIGDSFVDQDPSILDNIWHLENGWRYLLMDLLPWLPLSSIMKAQVARRRLRLQLSALLDLPDGDLEDYTAFFRKRVASSNAHGLSKELQVSLDMQFLSTIIIQVSSLVFWMILDISQKASPMIEVQREIKECVQIQKPTPGFFMPQARSLRINMPGLISSCPHLRQILSKCSAATSLEMTVLKATGSFTLTNESTPEEREKEASDPQRHQTPFTIPADNYIIIPSHTTHRLLKEDLPTDTEKPSPHKAESFKAEDMKKQFNPLDKLDPLAWQRNKLVECQALVTVAAFMTLWTMQSADTPVFQTPPSRMNSVAAIPAHDIRVRITSRIPPPTQV